MLKFLSRLCISLLAYGFITVQQPNIASAMDFEIITLTGGVKGVLASGDINDGDDVKLDLVLKNVPRDQYGTKPIGLASLGGSVSAALKMVKIMDKHIVSTFVHNMKCASACASILYISGKYHWVVGGILGMHTCYNGLTREKNSLCNQSIADNALAHGTPQGNVMMGMANTAANDMVWYTADQAECWGLTKFPPGITTKYPVTTFGKCVDDMLNEYERNYDRKKGRAIR